VLTVPRTAVVYGLYGDSAFVVIPAPSGDGFVVDRRLIRLGATRGERIAIVDGLKVGDKVVTAGQIKLQPKSPVVIDQGGALPPPAETPRP
jgi:multidrug efflux pump subunit AcrA (membrane-fusion protein)